MKLRIFSDLHNEFYPQDFDTTSLVPPHVNDAETIACFVGDIGLFSHDYTLIPFFEEMIKRFYAVLFVPGNHEYYRSSIHDSLQFDANNFFQLNNSAVLIDGIRFVGSTFWTDMDNDPMVELEVGAKMNDFRLIEDFSTYIARKSHRKAKRYITKAVQESEEPCVILLHHSPSLQSVNEDRYGSISHPIHRGYVSDAKDFLHAISHNTLLLAHGHTHASANFTECGVPVVANPRGYPLYKNYKGEYVFENYNYDPFFYRVV